MARGLEVGLPVDWRGLAWIGTPRVLARVRGTVENVGIRDRRRLLNSPEPAAYIILKRENVRARGACCGIRTQRAF